MPTTSTEPSASKDVPQKFSGPFDLIGMAGVGHFPQRKNPDAVARPLIDLFTNDRAG